MNKQTEALKMAIAMMEGLEVVFLHDVTKDNLLKTGTEKAIQACKEALSTCDRCGKVNPAEIHTCTPKESLEQPAQEPVAWISVDDKLPEFVTVNNYEKSSDDILILIDGKHVYVGSWIYDNWSKTNDFCMRDLDGGYEVVEDMKVTHWMPLPDAPKDENPLNYEESWDTV